MDKYNRTWKDGGTVRHWMNEQFSNTRMAFKYKGKIIAGPAAMDDLPGPVLVPYWFNKCHVSKDKEGVYIVEIVG